MAVNRSHTNRWRRCGAMVTLAVVASVAGVPGTGRADPPDDAPQRSEPGIRSVAPGDRASTLGTAWQTSRDRAWTTTGDADGLHLLVADAAEGYGWRHVATLAEPGLEVDQWIGNACLTGSGQRAVVVYAPRTFTNDSHLFERGGFTAVVDMRTGAVTKLPVQTSLAYYNPGCGPAEEVALTQSIGEGRPRTRVLRLDAASAKIKRRVVVPGQLTSAVPTAAGGIVAADAGAVVRVDASGTRRVVTRTANVPFKLATDAGGGVVYMERTGVGTASVKRVEVAGSAVRTLAAGGLTDLDVVSGRGGRVFVTGVTRERMRAASPVPSVSVTDVPAGARMSTEGSLAITSVLRRTADPRMAPDDPAEPQPVTISATVAATAKTVRFVADTGALMAGQDQRLATAGRRLSPGLRVREPAAGRTIAAAGNPNDPADGAARTCSVPRNDPLNQVMQPKPRQVEWAVDQAVRHALTVQRPANWKNLGMPAYTPQGLFPPVGLIGGGYVPAQIMLGIAAQESNLWQAARFALPGVTANPLIGNYFGVNIYNDTEADDWTINWSKADCGYGVTQVTDHMRLAGKERGPEDTAWDYQIQRAVALDFAANVAAGLQILQHKWNQVTNAGLVINNGDSSRIENWFYAVWAYNSGFYPNKGDGSPWGVGWANNPVNPHYPDNRDPFLEYTYEDAAHPQDWPYPEKVMGWAGHPIEMPESPDVLVHGFRPAWWADAGPGDVWNRRAVKPPVPQFCDGSNQCRPGEQHTPTAPDVIGEPAGPCTHRDAQGRIDLKCWYHQPSTWKADCDLTCGYELLRFDPGYAYQEDGNSYPPKCDLGGLPANAMIVDDVPDSTPSIRPNCGRPWNNAGTFRLTFKADSAGEYPGKIDTHQIGAGFGGHFWMTNTRTAQSEGGRLEVKATWKLNAARTGPMRLLVALPETGARTEFARYVVKTQRGDRVRTIKQQGTGNRWLNLGAFQFNGVPEVSLTSVTPDGDGTQRIAFDAMAFVPITGTYTEDVVEAVAVFDENQDIDADAPASWLGGPLSSRQALYDWGRERSVALASMPTCGATLSRDCVPAQIGTAGATWRNEVTTAGTDPVNHPAGASIGLWIGFAQPYTDRPTSTQRPAHFDNDNHYKIKIKATVAFVYGSDKKIIAGSEWVNYEHRTGNTKLPRFVRELFTAVRDGYGIAPPDLRYRAPDLNAHNGVYTDVDPVATGLLPGRAYAYAGMAPMHTLPGGSLPVEPGTTGCVTVGAVSGGSIGYRPMLAFDAPSTNFQNWVNRLNDDNRVARPVRDLAEDVREMFFNKGSIPGLNASIFGQAPPIWQELNFQKCVEGGIERLVNPSAPLLRSSWMPDHYLYLNGFAMHYDGDPRPDAKPYDIGRFDHFSRMPVVNDEHPYGHCDWDTDRSGNPWGISPAPVPEDPGTNPEPAHFCRHRGDPIDDLYSS